MKPLRILLVSQWFTPEPTFKGLSFAKALRDRGHEIQVLTGFPNYPEGRLYPGYRQRLLQSETIDGVSVLRVPLYPSHDTSALSRAANYISFAFSSSSIGVLAVKPADVMYVYHPPATVALPAMALRWMRRIPFVYDIQDLWPDTLGATGMVDNPTFLRIVDRWCRWTYRAAARIVVLSPGFKERLVSRGVPGEKIEVIYNWCEERHLGNGLRNEALARELGLADRFNVVFAGTMGKAQALAAVIDAAKMVSARIPKVQFVFLGGGVEVERLKRIAGEMRLPNVLFIPRRPVSEVGEILNLAGALLVHLKDDPLFRITIPSKIQAYFAMGRPILAGVRGDASDLIRRANAGLCCTPEDAASIAESVEKLVRMPKAELDAMGENGSRFYRQELAMDIGVGRFEEVFKSAAAIH